MFQLITNFSSIAELQEKLTKTVAELQHGASFSVVKSGDTRVNNEENEQQQETEPTGRRSSRRGVDNKPGEDAAAEPTGRRSRGTGKENPVNDNEEQAELRTQLVTDLQVLADDEKAHKAVYDALARVGSKSVHEIPSSLLGDFNEDIQPLLAETDETAGDPAEIRAKVITDLADLQDVIDNPENEGEDTDVTETLKAAWKDAGAAVRGSVTDAKKVDKIAATDLPHFAAAVSGLIAKYFG